LFFSFAEEDVEDGELNHQEFWKTNPNLTDFGETLLPTAIFVC